MEDVHEAQRIAKAILKAWTDIHVQNETTLVAKAIDAALDVLLAEWQQWVLAVRDAGRGYIETSANFVGDALKTGSMAKLAQETWDDANATFAEVVARRWSGPMLANFLNALGHESNELRTKLVAQAQQAQQPKPFKGKKLSKLRRKKKTKKATEEA